MNLQDLEKLARKNGTASTMIEGQEFEVSRITKSRHRRFSYRHGQRNMGRDEAERLLPDFVYDPAVMFPFATSRHTRTG